jgi:CheY-like chemotaxis protein
MLSNEKEEVEIQLSVKDTGIGIPKDKLTNIFEAFTQADNDTARIYGGTGLGLAIVKQLVELQNGSVDVSSTEGKGSCFKVRIKYKRASETILSSTYIHTEEKEIGNLNVLLVEDNMINQLLAQKVLSDWGWNVDTVENGIGAIEKIKRTDFDVVLMDIQMPEMDGYETTEHIRRLPVPKGNVPILAMTAHVMPNEEQRCYAIGMNGYISKPFNTQTLYAKIVSIAMKE